MLITAAHSARSHSIFGHAQISRGHCETFASRENRSFYSAVLNKEIAKIRILLKVVYKEQSLFSFTHDCTLLSRSIVCATEEFSPLLLVRAGAARLARTVIQFAFSHSVFPGDDAGMGDAIADALY